MKISFTIFAVLAGFTLANPGAQLQPIEERASVIEAVALPAAEVVEPIKARVSRPSSEDEAIVTRAEAEVSEVGAQLSPAELEASAAVAALDPNCIRCIKRICSKAPACLRLPAPAIIPCLLGVCAAGSAICCVFT